MARMVSEAERRDGAGARKFPPGFVVLLVLALLSLAGGLAMSVMAAQSDGPFMGDLRITEAIQDNVPLGRFTTSIRHLNNTEATLWTGTIAVIGLWYARRRQQSAVLVLGLVALVALTVFLKFAVDRDRPDPALIDVTQPGRSPSFPSGHAISSTMLVAYLSYVAAGSRVRKELKWLAGFGAIVMVVANGVGTIHAGVHWPTDVWGGYLWAVVLVVGLIFVDRAVVWWFGADASRLWEGGG